MSKRILLILQWFDPEPTFKGLLFAKELVKKGFDVEVVTGFPNYPTGKIYEGYKIRFIQKDIIEGVNIVRVPLYPSHNSSILKRILYYVSFAVSSFFYCLFGAQRADVIYAYHPPLTIGLVAVAIRFFRKIPVVYDIQDMCPDTLRATGVIKNARVISFFGYIAYWVYKRVDRIVVLSPGFKTLLVERGVPDQKINVIPNWSDESALLNSYPVQLPAILNDKGLKILYAGNMGTAQALDVVLESAKQLQKLNVIFIFMGYGLELENLKQIANEGNLNNVVFLPSVPMTMVGAYLQQADVLLVHLKKDPLFKITIPSKTQAYMSIGKPILMGVEGDAAELVENANAGVVFESQNAQSLIKAIQNLLERSPQELGGIGENGKHYYFQHLSLNKGIDGFTKVFNELSN